MTTEEDPPEHERVYYRHQSSGQLAYQVTRLGRKDMLKYDRVNEEIIVAYRPAEWAIEREWRPLTKASVARIAFEADKALCFGLGLHDKAKKEWLSLDDREKQLWMESGPTKPPIRADQYKLIIKNLKPITG